MEINTLPGLTADYSDLCLQAKAEGISYNDLILDILYLAAGTLGIAGTARVRAQTPQVMLPFTSPPNPSEFQSLSQTKRNQCPTLPQTPVTTP